jgi:inosine-uridine nucleoside N-ribohydrolase
MAEINIMPVLIAVSAVLLAVQSPITNRVARPVIITTDCGASYDDQWAIAHLAASPEFQIRGIVSTLAPKFEAPSAEATARACREVLGLLKLKNPPPVIAGSSEPLAAPYQPRRGLGVDLLLDAAKSASAKARLTVLMIGTATDVASALLIDPTWADRVEIIAMAFDTWKDGGDPWNVKNDLAAWRIVLDSRAPLVVGDDAICRRHLALSPERARQIVGKIEPIGPFLADTVAAAFKRNPELARSSNGGPPELPIWDEVVAAQLLKLTKIEERPRPALRDDLRFDHNRRDGKISWIVGVNSDRLWADLVQKLKQVLN